MSGEYEHEYVARVASNERISIGEVIAFMKEHFYPRETIFQSLLSKHRPGGDELRRIDEDQTCIVRLMATRSPCIAVVHKPTRRIAAMCMMIGDDRRDAERYYNVYAQYEARSKLVQSYVLGVASMIDAARIYASFPRARRALELDMLAVDRRHERRGLALRLLRESIHYARTSGFDIVDGLFTSDLARRAADKVGMTCLMDYELEHWCGLNGAKDLMPYRNASLMVLLTSDSHA